MAAEEEPVEAETLDEVLEAIEQAGVAAASLHGARHHDGHENTH